MQRARKVLSVLLFRGERPGAVEKWRNAAAAARVVLVSIYYHGKTGFVKKIQLGT
jgi:hypothetical protein